MYEIYDDDEQSDFEPDLFAHAVQSTDRRGDRFGRGREGPQNSGFDELKGMVAQVAHGVESLKREAAQNSDKFDKSIDMFKSKINQNTETMLTIKKAQTELNNRVTKVEWAQGQRDAGVPRGMLYPINQRGPGDASNARPKGMAKGGDGNNRGCYKCNSPNRLARDCLVGRTN